MASHEYSRLRARLKVLCLIGGLVSFGISSGQPRDPDDSTQRAALYSDEVVVDLVAQALLANYDVVALGRFSELPDSANPLNPEQVTVTFEPVRTFKGQVAEGMAVTVELISDMLIFPGRDQSRYVVRQQMFEEWAAEREELERQNATLGQDYQSGMIALEEYERSLARLREREERWMEASAVFLTGRRVGRSHGRTFYEVGGVIRPDRYYVVGMDMSAHDFNTFTLRDTRRSVFWGEWAEDLVPALTRRAR